MLATRQRAPLCLPVNSRWWFCTRTRRAYVKAGPTCGQRGQLDLPLGSSMVVLPLKPWAIPRYQSHSLSLLVLPVRSAVRVRVFCDSAGLSDCGVTQRYARASVTVVWWIHSHPGRPETRINPSPSHNPDARHACHRRSKREGKSCRHCGCWSVRNFWMCPIISSIHGGILPTIPYARVLPRLFTHTWEARWRALHTLRWRPHLLLHEGKRE